MKKQLSLVFSIVAALLIFIGCNNEDNNTATANPVIGTWKLTEVYLNGQAVAATSCELEETYIFGADQFTHELYGNSGARMSDNFRSALGNDDSDEDSDEHSDEDSDEDSDEHSDEDSDETPTTPTDPTTPTTDENSDEDSDEGSDDDNGGNGGTCVNTERIIGYWAATNNLFTFNVNGATTQNTIIFEDNNNRMYYEVTTTVNGQVRTKRYVFQRQ